MSFKMSIMCNQKSSKESKKIYAIILWRRLNNSTEGHRRRPE